MILVGLLSCWYLLGTPSALASFDDDSFDGNIFALYAGNGSIVPPRITLEDSLRRKKPALLVFYVDDSRDCKLYSVTISK
ncbi:MAG: thioredoxin family protein, partial [Moorea sp. SIO3I7]|nr:thioredoxin family protein [Moorena sp. SIO3I7]NEP22818.1 thioredoxin family protein [Moorena sp. SIO3I6]